MQVILPSDQSLARDHDRLVQNAPRVHWVSAAEAVGAVELLPRRSGLAEWVGLVERAGGHWASDQDLSHL
ncbi:MAG: hypothetical protein H0W83_05505 [Planctomycetes bacterium]|nr:hypothetical protein [Planctomycetota bacterium]